MVAPVWRVGDAEYLHDALLELQAVLRAKLVLHGECCSTCGRNASKDYFFARRVVCSDPTAIQYDYITCNSCSMPLGIFEELHDV